MNLTEKSTMADYIELQAVISLDTAFSDKIKAFSVPKTVAGLKIRSAMEIQLQHILLAWNIKDEQGLLKVTAKAYGLDSDKIMEYPLIDFIRLTFELNDTAVKAAEMFKKLKRENKDSKIKEILSKFTTENPTAIFVEIMKASAGAYTQEMAAQLSWKLAYDIIEAQTIEYDKQNAINELQEERMKNGTKQRK
jgi:hypothetical protein